ncbi:MAG: hypothetical protein HC794_06970 [Nitrospiraceae bacterium]|nr:hypothetical protein [Nitrospiraceae bacterium]
MTCTSRRARSTPTWQPSNRSSPNWRTNQRNPSVQGRFALTRLAEGLRSDAPDSVRAFVLLLGEDSHWRAWGQLLHSVRTGEPAFEHLCGLWDIAPSSFYRYRRARAPTARAGAELHDDGAAGAVASFFFMVFVRSS